ncbi:MAG: PilN domain-containing protein [Myxococcaceae bacterium]|nr:PilN domain-containing protein [Myxococcaceae bacterium]MBH2006481.1 PilN domain-containing protein [Myxococcaceae bacterium]
MAKQVIGFDLGSHSIKVVCLEGREVKETFEIPNSPEALQQLSVHESFQQNFVVSGISGVDAQIRALDVPFSNAKKIGGILGGLMDAHLPLEIDDLMISWFLASQKEDPQQSILAGFAKRETIRNYLDLLNTFQVNPNILTIKSAALFELLKMAQPVSGVAAVVDMGDKTCTVCVGDSRRIRIARSIGKSDRSSVLREIKQTMLSLDEPISQIYLTGGGALADGVEAEFSERLKVPCQILRPLGLSPVLALALSYALIGSTPREKLNRFNLRKEEFAFTSPVRLVSSRNQKLGIWALILLSLIVVNYGTRRYFLSARIDAFLEREAKLCEKVTGANPCLGPMKKMLAQDKQDKIPDKSALDIYVEVSNAIPPNLKLKLSELDIGNKGVRMSGNTADFESVDQIVSTLSQVPCFKKVEKGRARQGESGVHFQISMDYDCGASQ